MVSFKHLRVLLALPIVVLLVGTIGFMALENLSFLDALYFTVVTISTVGYGDFTPTTGASRGFSIIIIIFGISSFLTILTNMTQWLIQRGQQRIHRHRINMLIGVFFTEVGNELLRVFTQADPRIDSIRDDFLVKAEWTGNEFQHLKRHLSGYHYDIETRRLELAGLKKFLESKGDKLVHQLENENLIENEEFSELLWAVVHLRDELAARPALTGLPESDMHHIGGDAGRAYRHLARQWIDYMHFLQNRYPFLFSLAMRTNPFVESPSAIVNA